MTNFNFKACRVCGYEGNIKDDDMTGESYPWGRDGLYPNYIICDSCGVESGYGDSGGNPSHLKKIRDYWINIENSKWSSPEYMPKDWDLKTQLKNIPREFWID